MIIQERHCQPCLAVTYTPVIRTARCEIGYGNGIADVKATGSSIPDLL